MQALPCDCVYGRALVALVLPSLSHSLSYMFPPQARSEVSVPVTGDQTITARLGAEPQRRVTTRSAGAADTRAIGKPAEIGTANSCIMLLSREPNGRRADTSARCDV